MSLISQLSVKGEPLLPFLYDEKKQFYFKKIENNACIRIHSKGREQEPLSCWLLPARHSVKADRTKMVSVGILFQVRLKCILVCHPNN